MISFRYHLVSLTAVFLAIALGIGMGVTVIDKATVDLLENRLDRVRADVRENDRAIETLNSDLNRWEKFGEEAGNELISGRLADVPVVMIGMRGIDEDAVGRVRSTLVGAGSAFQGTIWFTKKMALSNEEEIETLSRILRERSQEPLRLQARAVEKIVDVWKNDSDSNLVTALEQADFLDFDSHRGSQLRNVPASGTRMVVVSGSNADIRNDGLAVPLVSELSQSRFPVLAIEPDPSGESPSQEVFVGPIRSDNDLSDGISTVDHADEFRGRIAVVLALQAIARGRIGHFGIAPGADRVLPETNS